MCSGGASLDQCLLPATARRDRGDTWRRTGQTYEYRNRTTRKKYYVSITYQLSEHGGTKQLPEQVTRHYQVSWKQQTGKWEFPVLPVRSRKRLTAAWRVILKPCVYCHYIPIYCSTSVDVDSLTVCLVLFWSITSRFYRPIGEPLWVTPADSPRPCSDPPHRRRQPASLTVFPCFHVFLFYYVYFIYVTANSRYR